LPGLPRLINGRYIFGDPRNRIGRIVDDYGECKPDSILFTESLTVAKDYSAYLAVLVLKRPQLTFSNFSSALIWLWEAGSLESGDIVAIRPSGLVCVLYRRNSVHNALFVTERCNSRCLMCSQPPRQTDDSAYLYEARKVIELADPETKTLGITGGEPTLLGNDLLSLLSLCRDLLPRTSIHLLTNGRLFQDRDFVDEIAALNHQNLICGIPLYSDIDQEHDEIVQAEGAFDQTILGVLNLARHHIAVELRTVIHQTNALHLLQLSEFIYRNLPFASHLAFMAMEPTGLALANIEKLWIDPFEYSTVLSEAVQYFVARGMSVSIYNHQLCTLPSAVWPFCRQSISDWKATYLPSCHECAGKEICGGLFDSAISTYHSRLIAPLSPRIILTPQSVSS
jgi:His-Xaa-Ser system radical SAM maturase HxsC